MVARLLFGRSMHGSAESYAALVILDGLTRALAPASRVDFVRDRRVDVAAVAAAYLALTDVPRRDLQEAAKRLWEACFGGALTELRRTAPKDGT